MADLLNIAIGPGDCVCTDFSDPSRLLGVNLPEGLEKLIAKWSSEKPDPYADLDSDSGSFCCYALGSQSSNAKITRLGQATSLLR